MFGRDIKLERDGGEESVSQVFCVLYKICFGLRLLVEIKTMILQ